MRIDQQPGFILHARPYRETSLLLDVFTRDHGRIGLVARGVRREKSRMPRGLLQPLQPLHLSWIARDELGALTGAEAASTPFRLSGETLLSAIYINELVLRLSGRNDAHPVAFAAYAECIARLAEQADAGWTLRRFERDFLADLGYALALGHDVDGKPLRPDGDYLYHPDAGAEPWRNGTRLPRVSGAALLALDCDERPSNGHLAELRGVVRAVVRHLIGGELKAWTLAKRPVGMPR